MHCNCTTHIRVTDRVSGISLKLFPGASPLKRLQKSKYNMMTNNENTRDTPRAVRPSRLATRDEDRYAFQAFYSDGSQPLEPSIPRASREVREFNFDTVVDFMNLIPYCDLCLNFRCSCEKYVPTTSESEYDTFSDDDFERVSITTDVSDTLPFSPILIGDDLSTITDDSDEYASEIELEQMSREEFERYFSHRWTYSSFIPSDFDSDSSEYSTDYSESDTIQLQSGTKPREITWNDTAKEIGEQLSSLKQLSLDDGQSLFTKEQIKVAGPIFDSLEAIVLFIRDIRASKDLSDVAAAFAHAVKHLTHESLVVNEYTTYMCSQFWKIWAKSSISIQSSGVDKFSEMLTSIIDGYETFLNSELVTRITETIAYLVSFASLQHLNIDPITNKKRFKDFSGLLSRQPLKFGSDFMISILKTIKFALEKGKRFWATGDIRELFFTESRVTEWNDRYTKVMDDAGYLSNPEPFGVSVESFEKELKYLLDEAKFLQNNRELLTSYELNIFNRRVAELKQLQREFKLIQLAKSKRPPPFSLLVFGSSGIGKSSFLNMLFCHFAKVSNILGKNLECTDDFLYTRTVSDKYWSGFSSYQWCILLDDIAMSLPSKAQADETLDEIVRIANTVPYVPEQAALEGKGTCPVVPKLFLGSTNVKDLNASQWFSVPLAIQRRFQFVITVKPKEEFALHVPNSDQIMLDPEKARLASFNGYDDFWDIKVEKVVPGKRIGANVERIGADYELILKTDNMNEFLSWYGKAIKLHYEQTEKMIDTMDKYKEVVICDKCFSECDGTCVEVQSGPKFNFKEENMDTLYLISTTLWFALWTVMLLRSTKCLTARWSHYLPGRWHKTLLMAISVFCGRCANKIESWILLRGCERIKLIIIPHKNTIFVITFIASMLIGCALNRILHGKKKPVSEPQSKYFPGSEPKKATVERENVWKWEEPANITNADISPVVCSSAAMSIDDQLRRIEKNCYSLLVHRDDGTVTTGKCLALGGQLYLTNAHTLHGTFTCLEVARTGVDDVIGCRRKVFIDPNDIKFSRSLDLAVFRIVDLPATKNIVPLLFNEDSRKPEMNGYWIRRNDEDGTIDKFRVSCLSRTNIRIKDDSKDVDCDLPVYKMNPLGFETVPGDCGSVVVCEFGGKLVICGIHVAFDHKLKKVFATRIDAKMINQFIKNFDSQATIQASDPVLTSIKTGDIPLGSIHRKSPFRFVDQGDASLYGSLPFREGGGSRVGPTLLAQQFVDKTQNDGLYAIKDEMHAPVMRGYVPKQLALSHMVRTSQMTRQKPLRLCSQAFLDEILDALPEEELKLIQVMDLHTSINGVDGIQYLDGIKRSTSAGFPWRESKRKHLIPIIHNGVLTDKVDISDEMKVRVESIEERYYRGERYHPVFAATLKDEPVTQEKFELGKTRVFAAAPLDFTLVARKFLLPVVRVIQRNKLLFETGVGCQAQSSEWDVLYKYITKFNKDRIIAGDYSKFDKKMSPAFMMEAFWILREICRKAGYTEEQLRAIDCISHDVSFPMTDYFGDLVMFHGTNPSGHPLTVIINSLVNSLYMRYAYYVLNPIHEVRTFRDNVSLLTYGDDNIMGVRKGCEWFNHTDVQKALSTIGVGYTMAEKDAESVPYLHISQTSFLKRSFRFDDDLKRVVGPLDHSSISKMLTKCVRSKDWVPEQHMLAVIKTALEEYFWYGKSVYENRLEKFRSIARENGLLEFIDTIKPFTPYDELVERYWAASEPFEKDVESVPCQLTQN